MFFTKGKIEKLHIALDEIGYRKKKNLVFDEFLCETKKTLTRCNGTDGMAEIFDWFNTVSKNWDLLIELSQGRHKYSSYFNSIGFRGNEILELLGEQDAEGTTVITNALSKDPQEVAVFSSEDSYIAQKVDGVFRFVDDDDWEYYLKATILKPFKFSFYTRAGEKLFQMTCDDDLDIYLVNNATSYDIQFAEDSDTLIIVDHSRSKDDQELAYIYSDIVGKGKKYGACQIDAITEMDGSQWELCLLIAMCTFFIYNKKLKSDENNSAALAWFALNN